MHRMLHQRAKPVIALLVLALAGGCNLQALLQPQTARQAPIVVPQRVPCPKVPLAAVAGLPARKTLMQPEELANYVQRLELMYQECQARYDTCSVSFDSCTYDEPPEPAPEPAAMEPDPAPQEAPKSPEYATDPEDEGS